MDQVQQNLSVYFDGMVTKSDTTVVECMSKIMQFFTIIEIATFSIHEYSVQTNDVIRLDLAQTAGFVMHFVQQIAGLLKFSANIPCLIQIHQNMMEKLLVCLEYLFVINKSNVLPINHGACGTPLCSPQGLVVSYG